MKGILLLTPSCQLQGVARFTCERQADECVSTGTCETKLFILQLSSAWRAGVIQAQRRHMFLSDSVRFDSRGTQMPLEIDVTTFLDESAEAATIY